MKRFICIVILLLSTFILSLTLSADVVHIPDPNLRAAVAEALNIPTGDPIPYTKMRRLRELNARGRQIQNLTGLEQATHLRKLHLGGNLISDISPLGMLTNLESLNLRDNLISDISPLANLIKLTYLKLRNNDVSDLTPLSNLTELDYLHVNNNQVTDISPLANLAQLVNLELSGNRITDVRPLTHLTKLKTLSLDYNLIVDVTPLDGLSIETFVYDTIGCDMAPLPLKPRIENRTFPSIFTAWSDKTKWPSFDLIFCCPRFGSRLIATEDGHEFRTPNPSWDEAIRIRDAYLAENPTMVFLHGLAVIWGDTEVIPADSPWWLRDENGDILYRGGNTKRGYMNLNHPGWQQRMIDIAVAIDRCGLYDGIFIDGWSEWHNERRGQLPGQVAILRGIRERVRDNFLIMVNTNDYQSPNSAPYINGLFMENDFPNNSTTPEKIEHELVEMEDTLRWAVQSLQEPRIIGLEASPYVHESPHTLRNLQWMRATTTLGLTFSDGYVAFPLRGGPWYDFWNADLGRPIGKKSTLYNDDIQGLYIREYTNGWAVYNHSGDAQIVTLPEEARSAANGWQNTKHAVLDLDGDIFLRIPPKLPGDPNGDGVINILDLSMVAQAIGTDKREADVNGDGVVNVLDLVFVADQF